jgi:predicted nucleotidyltransferase
VKGGQVKVNEKVESIVLKIQSIVADQVEGDYKLFLFGSRANGKSMERSDIDIMINKKIDASILAKIREKYLKSYHGKMFLGNRLKSYLIG